MVNDIESISNSSFYNHILARFCLDFLHSINDYVKIIFIEIAEEYAFLNQRFDFLLGLGFFGDDFGLESSLLVELTKDLGTDALTTVFLDHLLFLLFLYFSQKLSHSFLGFFF
jgi:hypothetical protein